MFKRIAFFAYGFINYVVFLGVFVYAIGFIGNIWVPTSLDGTPTVPFVRALLINLGLLAAFAIQHSGMARQGFKRAWTKIVAPPIERSTYVLFSNVAMIALFFFWEPMGGAIWKVSNPTASAVIYGVYAIGWVVILVSTFLINHFDLFGLSQVYRYLIGQPYSPPRFNTPGSTDGFDTRSTWAG